MAQHNYVLLQGVVARAPRIIPDISGKPAKAVMAINVIRGDRDVGDNQKYLKYDHPIIIAKNKEIIMEMSKWKENDFVEIKGMLSTEQRMKSSICQCGHKNMVQGSAVYVTPIYAKCLWNNLNKEEAMEKLRQAQEVSNQAFLIGTLCSDPENITTGKGLFITQFPIAINRKFCVKEDSPEEKTDYPYIKCYGKNAIEAKQRLKTNSVIFVDGFLQARKIEKEMTCENCKTKYIWTDNAMEAVPYALEFLQNFLTDEDIEKMKIEKANEIRNTYENNL